ncbi:MAG: Asp-tRNA(Asn)/Glu-tRNA(Gln) amidotransferase subunit GatB [Mariprofundaceae bacterium]|nr:Asp-tRNA(Asn)/Glu-tRNA(Gln) amidotransferase subunit GatB [Mariprofundaceae bacterium]
MSWEVVIGLEVHAQVNTNTKAFCGCSTTFGATPNTQTCPVCLGMPGQLPVLNREVARKVALTGMAIEGNINALSKFDRKNYFYPDLPKGYQITQLFLPIVQKGLVHIQDKHGNEKSVRIHQIHIEEDAGKSMHENSEFVSHIDLNRSGIPLMEIVSEPDMYSADEAVAYLKSLHQLLKFLNTSNADMEKGQFRCDANVSVRRKGEPLGTRAEIKNINSFRFVKQAIEYETQRQIELIEDGGTVVQETRLWDSVKNESRSMRGKEEAHDYRYFPEPDLPPLKLSDEELAEIRASMPELPHQMHTRFVSDYGLSHYDAEVLSTSRDLAAYYEALVQAHPKDPKQAANWLANELLARLKEINTEIADSPVSASDLASLLARISDNTISGKIAKDVLDDMLKSGDAVDAIIERKGLKQITDSSAIDDMIQGVMDANPAQLEQYRGGKDRLFGFFVGQVMKVTKGKANPKMVNQRLKEMLKG